MRKIQILNFQQPIKSNDEKELIDVLEHLRKELNEMEPETRDQLLNTDFLVRLNSTLESDQKSISDLQRLLEQITDWLANENDRQIQTCSIQAVLFAIMLCKPSFSTPQRAIPIESTVEFIPLGRFLNLVILVVAPLSWAHQFENLSQSNQIFNRLLFHCIVP